MPCTTSSVVDIGSSTNTAPVSWGAPPDSSSGWQAIVLDGSPAWKKGNDPAIPVSQLSQSAPAATVASVFPALSPAPTGFDWFTNSAFMAPAAPANYVQTVSQPADSTPLYTPSKSNSAKDWFSITGWLNDPTGAAASPVTVPADAVPTGSQRVTIQPSNVKGSWEYVLQHGDPSGKKAVLLDGKKAFRDPYGNFTTLQGLADDAPGINPVVILGLAALAWLVLRK